MQVGDHVRVLAPFDQAFPGVYLVDAVKENGTCVIAGSRDFAPEHLEVTKDALTKYDYVTESGEPPPTVISRAELKTWLTRNNKLATVNAYIATLDPTDEVRIFWEDEHYFNRASPALNALARNLLGMSAQEIDRAFIEASKIVV